MTRWIWAKHFFRNEIKNASDKDGERQRLIAEYEKQFNNPYVAADLGYIDEVIAPSETRQRIIQSLEMLKNKKDTNPPKKHGNIPL